MSQFLSQSMNQQMRMEQRLTPQLIQSMAVLQKPVAELEAYVADALEANAALEIAEHEAAESDHRPPVTSPFQDGHADKGFARADRYARETDWDAGERAPHAGRRFESNDDRDAKMGAMANTEGRQISLQEHLLNQWSLVEVDPAIRNAGEAIISRLDPDGYLRSSFADLAADTRPPVTIGQLTAALPLVQKLDPPGVGARDIVECLLLQLDALPGDNTIERVLIKNHLDDITHNRMPAISRITGYSMGEIAEAIRAMGSSLYLHPGHLVGDRSVPPIRPDVIIEYADHGGGLHVRLARGNAPQLRIRDDVSALAKSRGDAKETREFARKHVDEATSLIDAIHFRRARLLEVTRAIIEKQMEFFDYGPSGLKILRMSDMAVELNCDPSTISRTVADKYVQTPRGIFPLRYFFTGGTETPEGQTIGWDKVKNRVKELVDGEDPKNPLNDDQIADHLMKEGMEISRRTVAKYRQQLDIPAARQRKKF